MMTICRSEYGLWHNLGYVGLDPILRDKTMRRNEKSNRRAGKGDRDGERGDGMGFGRRRSRHLAGIEKIDPNDLELLRKFTTEHGKILPARFTGASAKQQRQIKRAVRRARTMGLLR